MGTLNYTKTLPVKYKVDVCVVGGGPAGMTAAIAAARQGCSVYLAESHGFFGGAATAALVPAFMPFDNGVDFLAGGLGREIYDRCLEAGFYQSGSTVGIHPEKYKKIMDDMVRAEEGIAFTFFTTLTDVLQDGGEVKQCIFAAKGGTFAVEAKVFIDGTGDGDLCAWAGAPYEKGDAHNPPMPSTLCSVWTDIDWENKNFGDADKLEEAFQDQVFTQEDRHLPGMWRTGKTLGGGNIGHSFEVDATDETSLTRGMLTGRAILPEYETYYNKYLGRGYADASIAITGAYIGVRESRRILGDYIMTVDDFNSRARFADEIGVFSYPIDIHIARPDKDAFEVFHKEHTTMRYQPGEYYGIPYRILLPKQLSNVYVVGRCVSTDRQMQSSIRVMPACFIMGQAAGAGAALAIKAGQTIRQVDIGKLRDALHTMGAFLPAHTQPEKMP